MKRLAIPVFTTVALVCLLVGALARTNPRFLASKSASSNIRESVAHGLLKNAGASALAQSPSTTYNINLSKATVSATDSNQVIIVMDAKGDLPGALTLRLERDAAGSVVKGGEWALVVAYTEEIQLSPGEGDGDPGEGLVQKGTLKGTISGGQVTLNPDGSIASINSLQLVVNGGSMSYDAVNDGSGSVHEENLQDADNASGGLTLSF